MFSSVSWVGGKYLWRQSACVVNTGALLVSEYHCGTIDGRGEAIFLENCYFTCSAGKLYFTCSTQAH